MEVCALGRVDVSMVARGTGASRATTMVAVEKLDESASENSGWALCVGSGLLVMSGWLPRQSRSASRPVCHH